MNKNAGSGWTVKTFDRMTHWDWKAKAGTAGFALTLAVLLASAASIVVWHQRTSDAWGESARQVRGAWPAVARDLRDPEAWERTNARAANLLRLQHFRINDVSGTLPHVAASWDGPVEVLAGKPGHAMIAGGGGPIQIHACPLEGSADTACRRWRGRVGPS